MYFNRGSLPW
jgi:hypothetical protein